MTCVQLFSKELPGKHPCLCSFKNVCRAVKRVCHRCDLDGRGQCEDSMRVSVCGPPGAGSVSPNPAVPDSGASIPFVSSDPEKVNGDVSFKPAFHALPTC